MNEEQFRQLLRESDILYPVNHPLRSGFAGIDRREFVKLGGVALVTASSFGDDARQWLGRYMSG